MVDAEWKQMVWGQLGGAIDMLENAIHACPDEVWRAGEPPRALWYVTFHTLFFLDLYTFGTVDGFAPPAPFTLDELDPAGVYPDRVYSRDELGEYLRACRDRSRSAIAALTQEAAVRQCEFVWLRESYVELLLRNLRHVQHHTAQLNWVLGERTGAAPRWVATTKVALS
jgi:DinB superfamily